jgi:hypothetical protein
MEVSRLRLLFLIALAATSLQGCALFRRDEPVPPASQNDEAAQQTAQVTGEPSDKPIIEPEVERR